jgi:hypothetical protein
MGRPKELPNGWVTSGFVLDPAIDSRLRVLAAKNRITRSDLFRRILVKVLNEMENNPSMEAELCFNIKGKVKNGSEGN